MDNKTIIFSAPSGSGKTTIVHHLLKVFPQLEFSVSATNRSPRKNEVHEKDYYFLSTEEFKEKISNDEFVEWEEVYNNRFYGTLYSELERIWKKRNIVVFDVDVAGGIHLKNKFGNNALSIFVKIPDLNILETRLKKRGTDDEREIHTRIQKAKKELEYAFMFDRVLINDRLNKVLDEAEDMVSSFINN